jgi:hypothetical protein
MIKIIKSASHALFAASLLGGIALVQPTFAADATSSSTSNQPTATTKTVSPKQHGHVGVEARIADLHKSLKITSAQEAQFKDFAQVMRDNAANIEAVNKERSTGIDGMNAVDDLRSYEKLADAHADDLKKLIPAFETLYNSMSDAQKKNADAVFGQFERRHVARQAKK